MRAAEAAGKAQKEQEARLARGRADLEALGEPTSRDDPWTRVAHALFNLKEFRFLR